MQKDDHFSHMLDLARQTLNHAYAPYSNFQVATCLRSEDNLFFTGCNIENASYGLTLCAEASALASLVSSGRRRISEIVVISSGDLICSPCGACRQRLFEFSTPTTQLHMLNRHHHQESLLLYELLPKAFNPDHLSSSKI